MSYGLFLVLDDGETYSSIDGSVIVVDGSYYDSDECSDINSASDLPVDVIVKRIYITALLEAYDKVHGTNYLGAKDESVPPLPDDLSALAELFGVAEAGEEIALIERLAVKAGLMYLCENCKTTNYRDITLCGGCGEDRPVQSKQPTSNPQ